MRCCLYELNLFGDPEMPMYTDDILYIKVTHPSSVPIGVSSITVNVKLLYSPFSPVANALVCAKIESDTIGYVTGYTDASGNVTLSNIVTTDPADKITITVTGKNIRYYEGAVTVATAGTAYFNKINCANATSADTFLAVSGTESNFWAVGKSGLAAKGSIYSAQKVSLGYPDYDLSDVCIVNSQYGWIVGYRKRDEATDKKNKYKGIILRTTDGGNTWNQDINPFNGKPDSLTSFLKVKVSKPATYYEGYISCGNGYILKLQTNGTWKSFRPPVPSNDSLNIWYNGLWMNNANPNELWISGDDACLFAKSADGGANWTFDYPTTFDQNYVWPDNTYLKYQTQLANFSVWCNKYDSAHTANSYGYIGQYSSGSWQKAKLFQPAEAWMYSASGYADNMNLYQLAAGAGGNIQFRFDYNSHTYQNNSWYQPNVDFYGSNFMNYYQGCYVVGTNGTIVTNNGGLGIVPWITLSAESQTYAIKVKWSVNDASGNPIVGYTNLYRSEVGGPFHFIASVPTSNLSYIDNAANYECRYRYMATHSYYECPETPMSAYPLLGYPLALLPSPTSCTVNDIAGDQGGQLSIDWNASYPVRVGKALQTPLVSGGQSVNWRVSGGTASGSLLDNVQLGHTFYYAVQCTSGNQFSMPFIVSGAPIDNTPPTQLPMLTGSYDVPNRIITLNWQESTDDPNLGGYWLCPEPLGVFASVLANIVPGGDLPDYHVEHAAPLQRTVYKYYVPDDLLGQTLGFCITAMDRSGNIAPWSQNYDINTKAFTNSNVAAATAYNNGRHLLYDNNGKLHLTYTSVDSVFYQNSIDDGYTWCMPSAYLVPGGFAAGGINPASVVGIYGDDTTITWKAETPVGGWVLKTAKRDNSSNSKWTEPQTILEQGGWYEQGHELSPPAMVVNSAGTHLAIERRDMQTIPGGQVGFWDWKLLYGFKPVGSSTFIWTVLDTASGSWDHTFPNACPTICIDSKGGIHVAWDYEGEIYWRVYDPYSGAWKNRINLSQSPDVVSAEPSLSFYGDVHLVWQEGNDIYHNKGNWGLLPTAKSKVIINKSFYWQGSENVSNSPLTASVNPVIDGNYIAWSEATAPELYKGCYANYADFVWQVEPDYSKNPTQPSVYPQIAYRQNANGNKMTTIWTEGTGPLYSLIARDTAGQVTAVSAADVGGTEPSIYTIERDGYLVYNTTKSKTTGITVDYDSTQLLYYLPTLDREQKQTVKINLYQEYSDKAVYIYQFWVDNVSLGTVKVPSGQMVTFVKDLPNAVSHDGEGVLKIVNLKKGTIVTCDNWQLFAYDKDCDNTKHGGTQSEMSEAKPVAYRYELMQNAPNPCSKQTAINYQLAKQGQVSLKVYNTLGQVVKTLVNESQNPGPYSVKWNGKDESGRQAAAGIYFYRIASGEFNSTKKMVILR